MTKNFFLTLILALLFIPTTILAVTETGVGSNVLATITPTNPRPGDIVNISLSGYGFDTNQSYFKWMRDGKDVLSGNGQSQYSFQLGRLGVATKIDVTIFSDTRALATKSFYFEPADIDFVWQADTFVPPFYKGKERASAGANIKILATPYLINNLGQAENKSNLNYSWSQDGKPLNDRSGLGKSNITIATGPDKNQIKIDLAVSTIDKSRSTNKSLIINLDKPELAFYEIKPLAGTNFLKQVIGSYDLYDDEASFLAIPYFWPRNQINNINYLWAINGLQASPQKDPWSLTVREPSGGAGQNEINLQVSDAQNSLGPVSNHFNIKFGNNLLKFNNANQ